MRRTSGKVISNSLWMMLEKLVGIVGLVLVNAYMARYIGPENFGKLAFTTSVFLFVQTFAWFGAQNILFKRFSQNVQSGVRLALSTQNMRRLFYVLASALTLVYLWFNSDTLTFIFGIGNFIASYFIVSDIYSVYNNSQLISIVNAITNIVGLLIALIVRFLLVFFEAEMYTMIYPIIILAVLPYMLRKYYFYKNTHYSLITFKQKKYHKYLFVTGGSLVVSSLSIVLYTQISNIFLAKFSSFSNLAIYNVALTLGGAWGFVNMALITSYFSKIYEEKNETLQKNYLRQIHLIVIVISILALLGVLVFGQWVIHFLYGNAYLDATELLPYIVIGTLLSALGTISYRYMLKFNAYRYLSIKMLMVSLLSIPLSYLLIHQYNVWGAAIGFVLVELISLTIANYFFQKGVILKMHRNILIGKLKK